ncbi:MAG: hypothetical protein U5N10_02020 [Gemmobacter sp.]|nr:hypothetical protein [Gemmobacter sp.]
MALLQAFRPQIPGSLRRIAADCAFHWRYALIFCPIMLQHRDKKLEWMQETPPNPSAFAFSSALDRGNGGAKRPVFTCTGLGMPQRRTGRPGASEKRQKIPAPGMVIRWHKMRLQRGRLSGGDVA